MSYETPETQDDTRFWEEAAQGRLVFQRCSDCAFMRWPAAGVCPECLGRGFAWEEVTGLGRVWSYVVYHRAYAAHLRERVPYNVALVELHCGVRLVTSLVDLPEGADPVGSEVAVRFEAVGEHPSVPVFAPVR